MKSAPSELHIVKLHPEPHFKIRAYKPTSTPPSRPDPAASAAPSTPNMSVMGQFFSTRFLTAVLCIFVFITRGIANETFSTEFGKREVPVHLIRRALEPHLNNVENIDLSRVVYEIINGNQLLGFGTKLDLESETTFKAPRPSASLKYTLNGNERLLTHSAKVRYGKGFTVLQRATDHRVVHVFGNGLNLKPLDALYPNIFVNTFAKDPTRANTTTNPVEVVKRIAVRNDLPRAIQNSTVRQSGSCASGTTHYLELAVAFDNQFCTMFSDDEAIATAAVQTLVNQADEIFQEFTCLSIALVHIDAHCNDPADPYAVLSDFSRALPDESESAYIRRAFGEFWEESRTDVRRDAAYFLSGFEEGTSTAGRAGIEATCNQNAYGWSEKLSLTVFTHELGHIAGSEHTDDGIMTASGFSGDSIFFSQPSIDAITSYVDSVAEDCLSVSAPVCDVTCPGPCLNGQCIARYSSNASPGIVPCSAVGGSFRCVDSEQHFSTEYSFATDCPSNFNYVEREISEASELDTFCCLVATDSTTSSVAPADYRFIRFTLNLPDGQRVFPEYIQDASVIETRTLLQTELAPSCQSPGGTPREILPSLSPGPTDVDAATPSPDDDAALPVPTPVADEPNIPVESVIPSASETPPNPRSDDGTCGAALADSETIICGSSFVERIEVDFREGMTAPVSVRLRQRRGLFKAVLRARNQFKLRQVAATLTTDSSLEPGDIGPPTLYTDLPERVTIEENAFEMAIPAGASTCCGENLYFYVQLEVCQDGECVVSGISRRETEILCSDPCASSPGGKVVPFSATKLCPSCRD